MVYVSATEVVGANEWSIDVSGSSVATGQFSDTFVKKVAGPKEWSASITSWDQGDDSILFDAAAAVAEVAVLIYPYRTVAGNYYSGNAIFSISTSGGTGSGVTVSASLEGDDTLTQTGFA